MKAAVNTKYGEPRRVISVTDIPKPMPQAGEFLIKVHFSSVNRTDDGFVWAKPFVTRFFSGLTKPRTTVLGCEYAGEVVEVGSDVTDVVVGDRIFGFDDVKWGGHAEYKVVRNKDAFAKIPKGISYEQAAASGEGTHYALGYIETLEKYNVKRVLVHGATGAIGSAAVQFMKQKGMYVIATTTTKDYKKVAAFRPDKIIDWEKEDFTKCGEVVDAVFDAVGKSSFKACKPLLKDKGFYAATELGPHAQNPFLGLLSPLYKLFGAKFVLFPIPRNNKRLFAFIAARLEDKAFTPLIDRTYDLEDIVEAYEYVETGQKTGNVLIRIAKD
jgi:NADPH:quinone reductase-like Zn-dependent oxidoreductase